VELNEKQKEKQYKKEKKPNLICILAGRTPAPAPPSPAVLGRLPRNRIGRPASYLAPPPLPPTSSTADSLMGHGLMAVAHSTKTEWKIE
jgi:hypothetical protein